ncbi:hypothetical protein [Methylobacterium sp. GC_Met_2]|uniref:hypothetical protein n=1 Tax=Methylobacterium sp. GC_Met_2 TaxID=2937376 RepID=UPI00226B13D9|nr:hypothetical protein [Methylobacterium sp. GC_Met_2]
MRRTLVPWNTDSYRRVGGFDPAFRRWMLSQRELQFFKPDLPDARASDAIAAQGPSGSPFFPLSRTDLNVIADHAADLELHHSVLLASFERPFILLLDNITRTFECLLGRPPALNDLENLTHRINDILMLPICEAIHIRSHALANDFLRIFTHRNIESKLHVWDTFIPRQMASRHRKEGAEKIIVFDRRTDPSRLDSSGLSIPERLAFDFIREVQRTNGDCQVYWARPSGFVGPSMLQAVPDIRGLRMLKPRIGPAELQNLFAIGHVFLHLTAEIDDFVCEEAVNHGCRVVHLDGPWAAGMKAFWGVPLPIAAHFIQASDELGRLPAIYEPAKLADLSSAVQGSAVDAFTQCSAIFMDDARVPQGLDFAGAVVSGPRMTFPQPAGGHLPNGTAVVAADFKFLGDWVEEHRVAAKLLCSNGASIALSDANSAPSKGTDLAARSLLFSDVSAALTNAFAPERAQRTLSQQQLTDFLPSLGIERLNVYDVAFPSGTTLLAEAAMERGFYQFEIDVLVNDVNLERGLLHERVSSSPGDRSEAVVRPELIFTLNDQMVQAQRLEASSIGRSCYTLTVPAASKLAVYVSTPRRARIFMSYPRLFSPEDIIIPKLNCELPYHRSTAWRFVPSSPAVHGRLRTSINMMNDNINVEFMHYRVEGLGGAPCMSARRRFLSFDRRRTETRASIEIRLQGSSWHLICGVVASQSRAASAMLPQGKRDFGDFRPQGL